VLAGAKHLAAIPNHDRERVLKARIKATNKSGQENKLGRQNATAELNQLSISQPCAQSMIFVPGHSIADFNTRPPSQWDDCNELNRSMRPDLLWPSDARKRFCRLFQVGRSKSFCVWGVVLEQCRGNQ
jgi:hypothetical protein